MKAIYNMPLTEIVTLNLQAVLVNEEGHWSNDLDTADTNTSFFDNVEANGNGNNSFTDE